MKRKTAYDYVIAGENSPITVRVEAGKGGVTQLHLDLLFEEDERVRLQNDRDKRNLSWEIDNQYQRAADPQVNFSGDPIEVLPDSRFSPEEVLFREKEKEDPRLEKLREYMKRLKPEEADILMSYFGELRYMEDIAKDYGMTRSGICKKKTRALEKLRRMFEEK